MMAAVGGFIAEEQEHAAARKPFGASHRDQHGDVDKDKRARETDESTSSMIKESPQAWQHVDSYKDPTHATAFPQKISEVSLASEGVQPLRTPTQRAKFWLTQTSMPHMKAHLG